MSISFPLHGSTFSAADSYLSRSGKQHQTEQDSNLLASIRDALRGVATTTVNPNNVREPTRKASFLNTDVDGALEEEITWNDTRVVHTQGRVIKRKWTFEEEGQQIQYACMGWLEQPSQFRDPKTDEGSSVNTTSSSNYEASSRPTFGPFHTHHPTSSSESSASSSSISSTTSIRVPAVFIFLRSIGFIYTISSGSGPNQPLQTQHTFALPFIVSSAHPLSPHGILIQRFLEPSELADSIISGEPVLPTIFALTSPFSESNAVCITPYIEGGFDGIPASLKDEANDRVLKSIPPTEEVIYVSHSSNSTNGSGNGDLEIIATLDSATHAITIWRYVYVPPIDTPLPLYSSSAFDGDDDEPLPPPGSPSPSANAKGKRRASRRVSALGSLGSLVGQGSLPSLGQLPFMPPVLTTTTTMASLVAGATSSSGPSSQWGSSSNSLGSFPPAFPPANSGANAPGRRASMGRRNSLTRNDLSMTMDRMALHPPSPAPNSAFPPYAAGAVGSATGFPPFANANAIAGALRGGVDVAFAGERPERVITERDERMRTAFWVEKVGIVEGSGVGASPQLALFDTRHDGAASSLGGGTRSLLSVCMPGGGDDGRGEVKVYSLGRSIASGSPKDSTTNPKPTTEKPEEQKNKKEKTDAERKQAPDPSLKLIYLTSLPGTSAVPIIATRPNVYDLLVVPSLSPTTASSHTDILLLTHGVRPLSLRLTHTRPQKHYSTVSPGRLALGRIVKAQSGSGKSAFVEFTFENMTPAPPPPGSDAMEPIHLTLPPVASATTALPKTFQYQTNISLLPSDPLVQLCLEVLALSLPVDVMWEVHKSFLEGWAGAESSLIAGGNKIMHNGAANPVVITREPSRRNEWASFEKALAGVLGFGSGLISDTEGSVSHQDRPLQSTWTGLGSSESHARFKDDRILRGLSLPPPSSTTAADRTQPSKSSPYLAPALYALHTLGEDLRLTTSQHPSLLRLAPLVCRIAGRIRPEWGDYWARLSPGSSGGFPSSAKAGKPDFDTRLPLCPPDISVILYGRISNPEWKVPWHSVLEIARSFSSNPSSSSLSRASSTSSVASGASSVVIGGGSGELQEDRYSFAYGLHDPLMSLNALTSIYKFLADGSEKSSQKRAENAVLYMVRTGLIGDGSVSTGSVSGKGFEGNKTFLSRLPLGLAAPIREAMRTCQMAPPSDWPLEAYKAVGRDDVAASASAGGNGGTKGSGGDGGMEGSGGGGKDGYLGVREFINPTKPRRTIGNIISETKVLAAGELDNTVSGVELDLDDFTDIRFGQDRRLEEVARMLCSSIVPSLKVVDRPELSEHDQTKEQQHQVLRIAERTLALPYGRAMFTYGSVPTVTQEAYSVPKLEYTIRLQPMNITVAPEAGKIPAESIGWGEFHNGVAAGLRISPFSGSVEASWIAFNKPAELTPEHAGFLFGIGLTGHLREMLTWHTFGYLTPKHDLTSIGVLLGLAAANVGNSDAHVTKLLAVHTPALLPTPSVDLNVSLMTQAAGLSGVGLLYLGTRNRRMAEVCLAQISRADLVQPDLSNEYREAYTFSAALAFGMVMLGKGTTIPADTTLLNKLSTLVHGDADTLLHGGRMPFDINLTSPAATIALGLMYLRTERQDIADILTIPETVLALNRIQPTFLLMRTLARSLIMWNSVAPTTEWLAAQIPATIKTAIEARFKTGANVDDALELAYYNIIAGCCFAVGLKYAGTARQEAYKMIIRYYDLFTRLVYSNGPTFDHRIKRSAVRDGLNLISISLSMVMAGTGEITCFRRLRYAYGMYTQTMYHPAFKYGIHVSTHMSLGLLFLGGGRFTLGTSDAAIACMVTAFFPRFHHISSDNKSYLQALRHLWVLAVEPRCLIARDVETKEVVYLPLKIAMKDEGITQLVSPTLIPDVERILSIKVDTPRYWPFYLDLEHIPRHKENLLRSQTLYVKRRTAFLSYTEDPRGSRSLFVRSRSSAGEAATLDFPQLTNTKTHPAGDLSEFITSFSNDALFLAFADHFCREDGETDEERLFQIYCHACLFDSILQGKPQSIQSHLTLFRYRTMDPTSQYFHLRLQDLRFAADFYSKIYERRFSGRSENNHRVPLIRDSTVSGALHALDQRLESVRRDPRFLAALSQYARGEPVVIEPEHNDHISRHLSWYLLRSGVPVSTLLVILKDLARDAHAQCLGKPLPVGTDDVTALDQGIREVLHATGTKMTTAMGSGWAIRSLDEIIETWKFA